MSVKRIQRVDAEPTAPAGGGAAVFEGVLSLMVHGLWLRIHDNLGLS
jgi:hypothetical protein